MSLRYKTLPQNCCHSLDTGCAVGTESSARRCAACAQTGHAHCPPTTKVVGVMTAGAIARTTMLTWTNNSLCQASTRASGRDSSGSGRSWTRNSSQRSHRVTHHRPRPAPLWPLRAPAAETRRATARPPRPPAHPTARHRAEQRRAAHPRRPEPARGRSGGHQRDERVPRAARERHARQKHREAPGPAAGKALRAPSQRPRCPRPRPRSRRGTDRSWPPQASPRSRHSPPGRCWWPRPPGPR